MKKLKFDENNLPDGAVVIQKEDKKSSKAKYWIGLLVVLVVGSTIREYQRRQVYETVKNTISTLESSIENLTPEEARRHEELQGELLLIFGKYLTSEEYKDFRGLIDKAAEMNLTQEEFERGNSYYFKAKSRCSPDEKIIFAGLEKISKKLTTLRK